MDQVTETEFLNILKEKDYVLQKGNTKEINDIKDRGWDEVSECLKANTGKHFEKVKLKKKWSNIMVRVKENDRKRKSTGGGCNIDLTSNDQIALDIMGNSIQ